MNKIFNFRVDPGTVKQRRIFTKSPKLKAGDTLSVGSIAVKDVISLPDGVETNEWIAVHIFDFYNQTNMIYAELYEKCTKQTCPVMTAGPKFRFLWADGEKITTPVKCSAPEYVDYLMEWVQTKLDDHELFHQQPEASYVDNFMQECKTIFKRLFRVYAHVYYHHFKELEELGSSQYLNLSFSHFVTFGETYNLLDKQDMKPLELLIESFKKKEEQVQRKNARKLMVEDSPEVYPLPIQSPPRKSSLTHARDHLEKFDVPIDSGDKSLPRVPEDSNSVIDSPGARSFSVSSACSQQITTSGEFVQYGKDILNMVSPPPPPLMFSYKSSGSDLDDSPIEHEYSRVISGVTSNNGNTDSVSYDFNLDLVPPPAIVSDKSRVSSYDPRVSQQSKSFTRDEMEKLERGFWTLSTFGTSKKEDLMKSFVPKVGIIGSGWMAENQILTTRAAGFSVEVLHSFSTDATNMVEKYNVPLYTSSLSKLLEVDVDFLIVCEFASRKHEAPFLELLLKAKKTGRLVLISPLSLPLAQRRACLEVFEGLDGVSPVSCAALHIFRSLPCVYKLRESTLAGMCGRVISVKISLNNNWKALISEWFGSSEEDPSDEEQRANQLLMLTLSQSIDVASWITGDVGIDSVFSQFYRVENENKSDMSSDVANLSLQLRNGVPCDVQVSLISKFSLNKFKIEVTGSHGILLLEDNMLSFVNDNRTLLMNDESVETTSSIPLQIMSSATLHFLQAVKLELANKMALSTNEEAVVNSEEHLKSLFSTLQNGFMNMRVLEAVRRQRMLNLNNWTSVDQLLRISPKILKENIGRITPPSSPIDNTFQLSPAPPPRRRIVETPELNPISEEPQVEIQPMARSLSGWYD